MKNIIAKSTTVSLLAHGKPFAILRPWWIIVDIEKRHLTIKRKNWHFISFDEETYVFKSIRNVKIDTHIFGADLSVKVFSGEAKVYYINKKIAKKIMKLLIDNDWSKNDTDVIIDY